MATCPRLRNEGRAKRLRKASGVQARAKARVGHASGNSKTPIGPFQIIVLQPLSLPWVRMHSQMRMHIGDMGRWRTFEILQGLRADVESHSCDNVNKTISMMIIITITAICNV